MDEKKETTEQVEQTTSEPGKAVSQDTDYIAAIKELKQNSVPKAEYDKLAAEKSKLVKALASGQAPDEKKSEPVDIQKLRDKLFNEELNNYEYVKTELELRNALIAKGEPDPFLPIGAKISPTPEDVEAAERVARIYQECLDYANGDSEVFTNELSRRTLNIK